jgi:asparagine synthase (glutamine-hydrolysing)
MCGIAGMIDLTGRRAAPEGCLAAMAGALVHRGPDQDGFLQLPGVGFASRRLSIVGVADGRQPIANEDRTIFVIFNGEIFDYPELRRELEGRGHRFETHCDTEVIPHLWEELHAEMFDRLRGQFALALWDQGRGQLVLARDRFGICPLYWTRQTTAEGEWLLFASEIKALLATGLVPARPDVRGIDQVFTFFAQPGPVTCFQGVQALLPGHFLTIRQGPEGHPAQVDDRIYWAMDYPAQGDEMDGRDPGPMVDRLEELLLRAVARRLRADVPVAAYLSGGVDSTLVLAMANRVAGHPLPAFTIRIQEPYLDETRPARLAADRLGVKPALVNCGPAEILGAYPALIRAAEFPVNDTCCAALLLLAREVHAHGYKVALTGEGADEGLAGYPWYKLHKLLGRLDAIPGLPLGRWLRRAYLRLSGAERLSREQAPRSEEALGGDNAWLDIYGMVSLSRLPLYGPRLRERLAHSPYEDLGLDSSRMRRWHPLNRSLAVGMRIHLPGLLLSSGGDRVAMHSSVETRYPFLDEGVVDFLASMPPRWKLHGLRDKYLLRLVAQRWLPPSIAWRPKTPFRAPFDSPVKEPVPAFVEQLLSDESLRRTGYFDIAGVRYWRKAYPRMRLDSGPRLAVELGLTGVVATQLWHHCFIEGNLCELQPAGSAVPIPQGGRECSVENLASRGPVGGGGPSPPR